MIKEKKWNLNEIVDNYKKVGWNKYLINALFGWEDGKVGG